MKSSRIVFYMPDVEAQFINELANRSGLSLSAWICSQLMRTINWHRAGCPSRNSAPEQNQRRTQNSPDNENITYDFSDSQA